MRVVYPYNEILPRKKAHDLFIFNECHAFAKSYETYLLCGKGSIDDGSLFTHYSLEPNGLHIIRQPIVRKNNLLNLSWNRPFFISTQKQIEKLKPDLVILSVLKQGAFHLKRKVNGVRYIFEVHELSCYPGSAVSEKTEKEREILQHADIILPTTNALKNVLLNPPYNLKNKIEVVPLAVHSREMPSRKCMSPLILMYVGQLYSLQGVDQLVAAMEKIEGIKLIIVGGKKEGAVHKNVEFLGYLPPSDLIKIVREADACVAPFKNAERMPYVAHTKLFEYAVWGKPFIAPDLPVVREHFSKGVLFFEPDNIKSLRACISALKDPHVFAKLSQEILFYKGGFSWEERVKNIILAASPL